MMSLKSAAAALSGNISGSFTVSCPGPRHSRHDRSLSVIFDTSAPDGFLVHSHANDDFRECRDYVKTCLGISDEWTPDHRDTQTRVIVRPVQQTLSSEQADRERYAVEIWNQSVDPRGTIVETYLRNRGLSLDSTVCGKVVRFHPSLKFEDTTVSGMVCLYTDIITNKPCGIHRTFLDANGKKFGRKMLGRAKGAAIKIDPYWPDVGGLHIGEGVESVLAGRMMDFKPAWALGSAGAIADFPVIKSAQALTVFRETDDSGANERAFWACAKSWISAGKEVIAITPKVTGDLNDVLLEVAQ